MSEDNLMIYKTIFIENDQDKYKYETYKVNQDKLKEYGKYLDKNIIKKIKANSEYTVDELYDILNREKPHYSDFFEYLIFRDIFNNYTEWILLLKKVLNDIDITKLMKNNENEIETNKNTNVLLPIFAEIGISEKDDNKKINKNMLEYFGVKKPEEKPDVNFDEFFPGKSNGKVVRYLKIYKKILNKKEYTKNDFKNDLINTGFVYVKKDEIYYLKEHLDDLKDWIKDKILK